ncbi:hypothetical protein [Zooshikella sp. RANM57]|uniref:hypothetical protein n=1 Tax=Zooshikella sp. RANM57 TaxID=3425863 RepID=UPI003D6DCF44
MPKDNVIVFSTAKDPHVHARKDAKVKAMRQRFEDCLPLAVKAKKKRKKKTKQSKKN